MTDKTRVLYNAECPVCRFEIDHYDEYAGQENLPIRFEDLNNDALDDWGLTRDAAARRLFVLKGGQIFSGIPAFVILWQGMPRYRWLARLVALPGVHRLASLAYDHVLAAVIYRWHLRRIGATSTQS